MLSKEQIAEIKGHLDKAQNPLFYYDNDADGLCSFVLLRRAIGKGKGVAAKSYPALNAQYAHKVHELNADYVFILDKPLVGEDFLEEMDKIQIPVVWIDHHDLGKEPYDKDKFPNVHFYNSAHNGGVGEPVTYLAYKILEKEEDSWIAMMGCIADHYLPDFKEEFAKKYPELWRNDIQKPFDALYKSEIGKLAQALSFGIKDSITHVVQFQNFLIQCKGPEEIFAESKGNENFRIKYSEIRKKYDVLLEKAKAQVGEKVVFFEYSGDLSISSEIANELSYLYPNRHIIVAYSKGGGVNISLRGKKVRDIFNKVIVGFEGASGGGHEEAIGSRIRKDDLEKFKNLFEEEVVKASG
ncbi:MAG: DHHA1 domain-containing protein [Nanoarchaeota archaeon]|nr:DHHA1 domain-containing protein [Nanoarchaeota archaeon]